jgi:hypothetical protein
MAHEAHTASMLTLAFLAGRDAIRRRMYGALAGDPIIPSAKPVEQRCRETVDRSRSPQRRAHVAFVAPQAARGHEDLV